MSRHRDVRCMNYSDEYDGYDDVYGHSVEDDYCVSPSAQQFLFDRSKQQNIASFITEPDIVEEDAEESTGDKTELSELEKAKLISCVESIKNVVGDTVSESDLKKKIIKSGFDVEIALNLILKESSTEPAGKDRQEHHPGAGTSVPKFTIPKIEFKRAVFPSPEQSLKKLSIRSPLGGIIGDRASQEPRPKKSAAIGSFACLADLTAHHLNRSSSCSNPLDKPSSSFVVPSFSKSRDSSEPTGKNDTLGFSYREAPSGGTRTPSPDNWTIDLSIALKEAESLTNNNNSSNTQKTRGEKLASTKILCDEETEVSCLALPTTLNLSDLRNVKLPHAENGVSLFGRTLCKNWKPRRPVLKTPSVRYRAVKRFDFSTPYTRA